MSGSETPAVDLRTRVEDSRKRRPGDRDYRAYVGPPEHYDFMGATQFRLVTAFGLREDHVYLDIGCGSLRAGKLILQYLLPGGYHGIEPNRWLIDDAIANEIGETLIRIKEPRFSHSDDFDLQGFGRSFDFLMAQSIFSHTGVGLFRETLAKAPGVMNETSQFFFTAVTQLDPGRMPKGSTAEGWIYPGCVRFGTEEVLSICRDVGLHAQRLDWFHPRQTWFRAVTSEERLLSDAQLEMAERGTVLFDARFGAKRGK